MEYTKPQLYAMINAIEEARYEVKDPQLKGKLGNISDLLDSLIVEGVIERNTEDLYA
jgi:hypothetical protein